MSSYLSQLRAEGYSSLRDIHFESQRTNFPLLGSFQPPQPVNMFQVDLPNREADDDYEDNDTQTGDPPETEKVQVSNSESEPNNDLTASDPKSPTIDNDIMTSPTQFAKEQTNNPAESEEVVGTEKASSPTTAPETQPTKVATPYGSSLRGEHVVPGPLLSKDLLLILKLPKPWSPTSDFPAYLTKN